jgi:hypothetical protein
MSKLKLFEQIAFQNVFFLNVLKYIFYLFLKFIFNTNISKTI